MEANDRIYVFIRSLNNQRLDESNNILKVTILG